MIKKILLIILCLLAFTGLGNTATYYIDYNAADDSANGTSTATPWKRVPGMTGFAGSYSHSAGDVFIFKGGVTWPKAVLPFNIAYSGSAGNQDTYTVDQTWYTGGSYTKPIFDGETTIAAYTGIFSTGAKSYITINGLKFIRVGAVSSGSDGRAIAAVYIGESIIISNNEIISDGKHAIVVNYTGSTAITSGIKIFGNDISKVANAIEISLSSGGSEDINAIEIYDNDIHDVTTEIINADHGDGIHIWSVPNYQQAKTLKIYNNRFYGDYASSDTSTSHTAQIYLEDCCNGVEIYNNDHSFSNTSTLRTNARFISPGFITVNGSTNVKVMQNSFNATGMIANSALAVASCIAIQNTTNATIKGNLMQDTYRLIYISGNVAGLVSEYNMGSTSVANGAWAGSYNVSGITTDCTSGNQCALSVWDNYGLDTPDSTQTDPKFVSITDPLDLQLQITSPALEDSTDLTAEIAGLATDHLGVARPQGAIEDIGAYELASAGAVSGTITADNMTEATIVTGGATIVIDIVNDTLVADDGTFAAAATDMIALFTSTGAEAGGWVAVVNAGLTNAAFTRNTDTRFTILLPAFAAYAITANETITTIIPASMLVTSTDPVTGAPTYFVSNENPAASVSGGVMGIATGAPIVGTATGAPIWFDTE